METAHKSPIPSPRTKRSQPKSDAPCSPLMIKCTENLLNFEQAYGVKFDKGRIHSGQKEAFGSVYGTSQNMPAIVIMNEAMSMSWNYFEVEIISTGEKSAFGIGVGPSDNRLYGMPGWTVQSFGYHADDGKLYHQNGYGLSFGPTCIKGDVMGCGIDYEDATKTGYVRLWFTKNAAVVGSPVKAKLPSKGFHSLIGLRCLGAVAKYLGHSQKTTPPSIQRLVYPHDSGGPNQLTLRAGDEVEVTEEEWLQEYEWLEGKKLSDGKVGLFCRKLVKFKKTSQPIESAARTASENASHIYHYQGSELAFLKEPETWYACIICQELAVSPLQTTCCAQTLCQSCTDTCRKCDMSTCPHCRNDHWETTSDARLTRLISNLEVLCQNYLKGCQWHGELRNWQDHLQKKCDFEVIQCPSGCSVQIERKHLARHMQVNCLDSRMKCPFCGSVMTKRQLFFHHYKVCANWPALCPHMCKERSTWTKGQLTRHLEDGCDEEIVQCEFACAGCKAQLTRRELVGHRQYAMASHLALLLKENIALKKELKDLKDTIRIQLRLP